MKDSTTKANEILGQVSGKTVETMTVWAEANQRVMQEMLDLSVGAAKEGVRLYAELQQGAIEAMRDSQATAMRWQTSWHDTPKDPMEWYQKALADSVDGAQKLFRFFESNAHAMTRSAERLQTSAEQAGKSLQNTFEATVTRMKDTYIKN